MAAARAACIQDDNIKPKRDSASTIVSIPKRQFHLRFPPPEASKHYASTSPQIQRIITISLRQFSAQQSGSPGSRNSNDSGYGGGLLHEEEGLDLTESSLVGTPNDPRRLSLAQIEAIEVMEGFQLPVDDGSTQLSENVQTNMTTETRVSKRQRTVEVFRLRIPWLYQHLHLVKIDPFTQVCCTACTDSFQRNVTVTLSCHHQYCLPCFDRFIQASLERGDYPTSCCNKAISARVVRKRSSTRTARLHEAARLRSKIPIDRRWYCPKKDCLQTIDIKKAKKTSNGVVCKHCHSKICVECRGMSHNSGEECQSDQVTELLKVGKELGWRRCGQCFTMIELTSGCNHLRCTCGHQFCYVCERPWLTCEDLGGCVQLHDLTIGQGRPFRHSITTAHGSPANRSSWSSTDSSMSARERMQVRRAQQERLEIGDAIARVLRLRAVEAQERADEHQAYLDSVTAHFKQFHDQLEAVSRLQRKKLAQRHKAESVEEQITGGPSWFLERQTEERRCLDTLHELRESMLALEEERVRRLTSGEPRDWWEAENEADSRSNGKERRQTADVVAPKFSEEHIATFRGSRSPSS